MAKYAIQIVRDAGIDVDELLNLFKAFFSNFKHFPSVKI
jgi:hypothetical protein